MKKTEVVDILLTLCNSVLLRSKQAEMPCLTPKEWNEILSLAAEQGVLPVITPLLTDIKFDDEASRMMLVKWYAVAQQNKQRYAMRLKAMQYLAKIFGQEGIDIMFMKGAALAQLYPEPTWRVFSDIDYYLYGDSERGIEVMKKHGIENSAYYHHHTQASLNGILLENHYDFVERVNHRCDIILDDALKEMAEKEGHTIVASFLGDDVKNAFLMTPTMNAVFLMRHMSAHFVSETVPLRMLYDWALFLKKYATEVDWGYVVPLYEKSGMMTFVGIIMMILKSHLEFECPICPVELGTQAEAERVWESIINPPTSDPYDKFTLRYYLFEARTFFANRWKHKLVYPGESFVGLFFKYVKLGLNMMIKRH